MTFRVINLFEYDCVLTVKACSIECECHFDFAVRHECLELLLSGDLIAAYVKDRFLSSLVHQDALGCVGLTLLEVLILDKVNECDLLLRTDILVLAIDRCCSSDLRDIISDGLKINESVLGFLIYREVELLEDLPFIVFARHLLKDI